MVRDPRRVDSISSRSFLITGKPGDYEDGQCGEMIAPVSSPMEIVRRTIRYMATSIVIEYHSRKTGPARRSASETFEFPSESVRFRPEFSHLAADGIRAIPDPAIRRPTYERIRLFIQRGAAIRCCEIYVWLAELCCDKVSENDGWS